MIDWPFYEVDERESVERVLASGRVNQWNGEHVLAFEREFATAMGSEHAVAVANGTLALELALKALGIGEGDEVVVTSRTFVASASSIAICGARPVFADVDPDSQNITPESAEKVLTPRTRAILAVHLAGWPCDMVGLRALATSRGLLLIEDCAQAHGATLDGRVVGNFGDAAAFSFCTDKIMTTGGEGGMVLFREEAAWRRAWSYKDHGKDWDAVYNREHPPGFRWLHESIGTNWRMTEIQAAIGRIQLRKLPDWLERRRRNSAVLTHRLSDLPALRIPQPPAHVGHAYYKYYAFVRSERLRHEWNRERIAEAVQAEGIPCAHGSCSEVYLEKAFEGTGWQPENRLPVARELGETSLMFQVHPTLTHEDMHRVADVVTGVIAEAASQGNY